MKQMKARPKEGKFHTKALQQSLKFGRCAAKVAKKSD
jgi:hypothetical protein